MQVDFLDIDCAPRDKRHILYFISMLFPGCETILFLIPRMSSIIKDQSIAPRFHEFTMSTSPYIKAEY